MSLIRKVYIDHIGSPRVRIGTRRYFGDIKISKEWFLVHILFVKGYDVICIVIRRIVSDVFQ